MRGHALASHSVQEYLIQSGPEIGHWTAARLDSAFWEDRHRAIGLVRAGQIVAGVIYENWNKASIMAHMVVEGRLNKAFISAIFDYAYRVCGVEKVICPVVETNTKSMGLLRHMGFAEEARLRDCSPQGDIVLFTLRRQDCRFLGDWSIGQKSTTSSRSA